MRQFNDIDKQALKTNAYRILSKIYVSGTDIVFTEDDCIVDWNYEDYRYVPNNGFIGQFVERILDGNLRDVPSNITLDDKEIGLEIGIVNNLNLDEYEQPITTWYYYGDFLVTKFQREDTTGKCKFEACDFAKKFNKVFETSYEYESGGQTQTKELTFPCTASELAQFICDEVNVNFDSSYKTGLRYIVGESGLTAGKYCFLKSGSTYYRFTTPVNLDKNSVITYNYTNNQVTLRAITHNNSTPVVTYYTLNVTSGSKSTYTPLTAYSTYQYSFTNNDFVIESNQYDSDDTCRKVIQDIAKLAYSWAQINPADNRLYFKFTPMATTDVDQYDELTTDEYYVSKKNDLPFGPVNKVLIGMSNVDGENMYKTSQDYTPETECAIKIWDNNLTNTDELRAIALYGAERLFGITYTPMEIDTVGHPWLEGDELIKLTNVDGEVVYTYPFNRSIKYNGVIEGKISSETGTVQENKYEYTSDIISSVRKTAIEVDKENQRITALAEDVSENTSNISTLNITVGGIETRVQSIETTEVTAVTNEYAVNTDPDNPPAQSSSSWSTTQPTRGTGEYIWARIKTTYKSGNVDYSDPVNTTGDKGDPGQGGKGISSIDTYYKTTSTQTEPSAASITSTTIPTMDDTDNKYLWQKTVTNYTTGNPDTAVALIGIYGDPGQQGQTGPAGADGNGIQSVTYYYATTTTQSTPSAGNVTSTTIPTMSATNKYLWQKEVIKYTKSGVADKVTVALIGVYGDKGNAGDDGASIDTITEYYAVSSSNTTAPSSWTTDVSSITLTATNKYLWNYTRITYTEGKEPTGTTDDAKVIGVYGDKGNTGDNGRGIVSITEYYLATSASSGVTRSTSGWTTTIQTMTSTNKYLWNYEKIVYTSGTTTEYVEPMIIGVYGLKGDQGNTGKGISSVTELYYVSNSSTAPSKPSSHVTTSSLTTYNAWNLQCPPYTTTYKYFYTCSEVLYTDNTYDWTNVTQNQGLAIANQNAYTANNTANSANTTATAALTTVNNLQIGGRNYILNSAYLTINNLGSATGSRKEYASLNVGQSYMNIPTDTEVTISFDLEMSVGTANPTLTVYNTNNKGPKQINSKTLNFTAAVGSTIKERVYVTTTVVDRNDATLSDNYIEFYSIYDTNNFFKITHIKLEVGNKATDWTKAPEDDEKNATEIIVGTQTAATNSWTGNASFSALRDGQQIAYWLPYAGNSSGATLNLTLSDGTTTGAKNCYYSGTTRITTHYAAGNVIHLTYRVNANVSGTNYTGWWADANYDSNNFDRIRLNNSIKMDQQYGANSRLVAKGSNDLYTIIKRGSSFAIDSPILMLGSNISPITTNTNSYLMYSGINITNNLCYCCDVATETITSSTKGYAGTGITGTSTTATVFSGSGVSSAAVGDLYINTSTYYLYKCTTAGNASTAKWVYVKSLYTAAGKRWYYGNKITGTSTTATVFSGSGVSSAAVGDQYFNSSTGYYYECTLAGNASTAKWVYKGILVELNKILYLRGTLVNNVFTVDKVPFTTTVPTTDDGLYYISIGNAYGLNAYGLFPEHPIYKYVNGEFKVLSQVAYEANLKVDTMEIGGRNLLKKSNEFYLTSSDTPTYTTRSGNTVTRLNVSVGSQANFYNWATDYLSIPVTELTTEYDYLVMSMDIKITGMTTGQMYFYFDTREGSSINRSLLKYVNATDIEDGVWTRISDIVLTNDGTQRSRMLVAGYMQGSVPAGTVLEYKNIKIETGNKSTAWTEAPEDVAEDIASIAHSLSSYVTTETYTAGLANTAEELKSWSRGELVTTSDFGTYSQYMEGQLSQKAGITEISSTATQIVNDAISGISETVSDVKETFTFDTNGLKIARGGNSIYLQLQNDELAFRTDNTAAGKKAYMTSNAFVLNQLSELRLGNFGFVVRANGSVDFKKVK